MVLQKYEVTSWVSKRGQAHLPNLEIGLVPTEY
jgi:hypothetical protein